MVTDLPLGRGSIVSERASLKIVLLGAYDHKHHLGFMV